MTAKEATTLMATAKTAKEHVKPAHYLNQDAEQFEAEAKDHDGMIEAYRQNATGWLSNSKYDLKPQMSANVNSIGQ